MQPEALCLRYKTRAELREILQYWISSFCGSSDQVDNDSGKHMQCKPPPTHLLPPWLMYQDRKLRVMYNDGKGKRIDQLMHLYFLYGDPNFESLKNLDISHRCHRYWCTNPQHILMENTAANVKRNSCGATAYCRHNVKCAISGGTFYRQRMALLRFGYDYQGGALVCNKNGCSDSFSRVDHLLRHLRSCWGSKRKSAPGVTGLSQLNVRFVSI